MKTVLFFALILLASQGAVADEHFQRFGDFLDSQAKEAERRRYQEEVLRQQREQNRLLQELLQQQERQRREEQRRYNDPYRR